jgi:hypothetical protein
VLAAVVWNDGPNKAVAQISLRDRHSCCRAMTQRSPIATGNAWPTKPTPRSRCRATKHRLLCPGSQREGRCAAVSVGLEPGGLRRFRVGCGSRDRAGAAHVHQRPIAAAHAGREPHPAGGTDRGAFRQGAAIHAGGGVRRISSTARAAGDSANSKASLLLDQGYETTAFPELTVSGGEGAQVDIRYAEALFLPTVPERAPEGESQ